MRESEQISVPILARLSGVCESTIWEDVRLLQSLLEEDERVEVSED